LLAVAGRCSLGDRNTCASSLTLCRRYCRLPACLPQITKYAKLEKKAVDDVLGGAEAWKNVQKTDGTAPLSVPLLAQLQQPCAYIQQLSLTVQLSS
jgi:hypothetical protein